MDNHNVKDLEIVYVDDREVSCNGGDDHLGHPKVYLYIKEEKMRFNDSNIHLDALKYNHIICPYCSKVFVYKHSDKE